MGAPCYCICDKTVCVDWPTADTRHGSKFCIVISMLTSVFTRSYVYSGWAFSLSSLQLIWKSVLCVAGGILHNRAFSCSLTKGMRLQETLLISVQCSTAFKTERRCSNSPASNLWTTLFSHPHCVGRGCCRKKKGLAKGLGWSRGASEICKGKTKFPVPTN